jgi:cytochrome c biogenesis protein CcmG/thiol:disulfide interchange protein DsbE
MQESETYSRSYLLYGVAWGRCSSAAKKAFTVTLRRRVVLVIAASGALFSAGIAAPREPAVDTAAPDFHVTTFDGSKFSLADFKGQVLVLNFWATWCTPCKKELPMLDAFYRLQKQAGLRVLAVTTDRSPPLSQLKPLAAALAIPVVRRFKGDYGPLKGLPTNYVIDRDGIVRYAKAGAFTLDDMHAILEPLLREHVSVSGPGAGIETQ